MDGSPGAFESALAPGKEGGTREQVALAYTLGVRNMVVRGGREDGGFRDRRGRGRRDGGL